MEKINVNDVINGYKLTKEINIGGFCNSYSVQKDGNVYFMKQYGDPTQNDKRFKEFFQNQVTIIERLNRMGSITEYFVDHFIYNGIYYQVKDLLTGINLDEWLSNHGKFEERLFLSIVFTGVIKGLHSQNIVHQDLKPAQVMMIDDETGKKTKLGYRITLSDFDWSIPDGNCVQIIGTPFYKSPEHYRNATPNSKSDIFTIGIMLCEFLTGKNPFNTGEIMDDAEIGKLVNSKRIRFSPKEANDDISDKLNNIILRCIEVDYAKRPSIEEIQKSLIEANNDFSKSSSLTPPASSAGTETTGSATPPAGKPTTYEISAGGRKYLIYGNQQFGRNEIKTFFKEFNDSDGHPLYLYCNEDRSMLSFSKEPDNSIYVSAAEGTKNYFRLNDTIIKNEKIKIKKGDKLILHSLSKSKDVGTFDII